MDSNGSSPSLDNAEAKPAFKKPSNDAGSRRYRRRSPIGGSSSSEDLGRKHERSSSPINSRADSRKDSGSMRRKDVDRDLDRNSGRQSSRSSYDNRGRDNYNRRDKVMDGKESYYSKSSSHRDSRSGSRSDHARKENDKSRHHSHGDDKYSRDRSDGSGHRHKDKSREERRDYRGGDRKGNRSPLSKSEPKESYDQKYVKEEKMKLDDLKTSKQMDRSDRQPREQLKEKSMFTRENDDSPAKKHKSFSGGNDYEKDVDEGKSSKQAQAPAGKVNLEQAPSGGCTAADIDAAKIIAMKAAESVNKNLMGTGYMSADQKKKLLWGNKKSTPAEKQPSHPWDTVTFSDREQQEKFNKLMGVKVEVKADHNPNTPENSGIHAEKQKEMQIDLEKQYIAGLRRRDGRTVGLGL